MAFNSNFLMLNATFKRTAVAHALGLMLVAPVLAQTVEATSVIELPTVTVTASNDTLTSPDSSAYGVNAGALVNHDPVAQVSGFGNTPISSLPMSIQAVSKQQVQALGAKRLADLNSADASMSDAYNVTGYYDYATMRGFILNNKFNYRRDGLPINAETAIALSNKERVELLKGTSGIQSGTSSPAGLVNYVVKRPTNNDSQQLFVEVGDNGNTGVSIDMSRRFGRTGANGLNVKEFGVRINAAVDKLNTPTENTKGKSSLLAVALDWRVNPDSLLSFEVESSRHSQMSVPALSLFGNRVPDANAIKNINNQPWSLPVVLNGNTASLKFEQAIGTAAQGNWRWHARVMTQRLKSDDRAAFPFGCSDASGGYYFNTYCPNGDYDLYDFSSINERRETTAGELGVSGTVQTGKLKHLVSATVLRSLYDERGHTGAYNPVGITNFNAPQTFAADPSLTNAYTNRNNKTTELSLTDAIEWNSRWTTWLGVRHTRLNNSSVYEAHTANNTESFTTPWGAVSYAVLPNLMAYVSHGQGTESNIVPNKSDYGDTARGHYLATVRSKQTEVGFKLNDKDMTWSAAAFNISRPFVLDTGSLYVLDGTQTHKGFEFSTQRTIGAWDVGGSFANIQASVKGVVNSPELNGQTPVNVPKHVLRANVVYRFPDIQGLTARASVSYEAGRNALIQASNNVTIPAWRRVDAGLSYKTTVLNKPATWAFDVYNLLNKSFFKESPTLYGHVYLVPQTPRTMRLSLNFAF
jgi:iron complex outermembrane recepter protein